MKIVIAAWHVKNPNVGLGRYARGLIDAIGRVDRENQYEILIPSKTHPFTAWPNVRYRMIRFPFFKRRFWEQAAPFLAGRHDLLHFPYDSRVAWKRAKFVTTIHDVKPLLFGARAPHTGPAQVATSPVTSPSQPQTRQDAFPSRGPETAKTDSDVSHPPSPECAVPPSQPRVGQDQLSSRGTRSFVFSPARPEPAKTDSFPNDAPLPQRGNLNRRIERALVGDRGERIDHVLTDSECSRRDIIAHLGVPPDRVTVVYPGIDLETFRPALSEDPSNHSARPYVFCVAGADPTKNVDALIDAFARLPGAVRDAYDLVLAGDFRRRPDLRAQVVQSEIEAQTIFTGVVSDQRLIDLYRAATVFVFPSLYEGFGLPVLEAMACGCPVISSDASSLPEVAGDAAVLVNPRDVAGLTSAMDEMLRDGNLRLTLRRRGLEQAARFPWARAARETIAVYRKVVGAM